MTAKQLKQKLDRRERLQAELTALDREIARESRAYWQARGVMVLPRPERLRAAVEAELA